MVVVELFISNKYYCWRGKAGVMATGPKKCHFPSRKRALSIFHPKNFHPCAGKTMRAESGGIVVVGFACMACIIFLHLFIRFHFFFTKCFKTYNFGKAIALSGKHEFAFSSRTCRQKLHFCVSTVNECVFIILLLA